ncbi:MAG: hypothetical protein LBJ86_00660, partial [Spirochaetaceae bacterium]|nr:hypothetical protein [Spirochaetaceae bacterium]
MAGVARRRVTSPLLERSGLCPDEFFLGGLMKNKSFLFLIAALALGLAFASCGGDTEIEYRDRDKPLTYVGYNDALAIMDAFKRGDVYLTAETDLTPATPLLIPENRTLYLNGQTVIVGSNSVIIKAGDLAWTGTDDPTGESSKIEAGSKGAVLINITADPTHYGSAGVFGAEGTASFTFVPFGEVKSANGVNYFASQTDSAIFNTAGSLATGGGTTAYFIGDRNANGVLNTNSGTLVVTGNLTGLTTLTTNTPLMVYGELAGGTNAAADFITGNGKVEANKVTASGGKIGTLSTRTGNFNG